MLALMSNYACTHPALATLMGGARKRKLSGAGGSSASASTSYDISHIFASRTQPYPSLAPPKLQQSSAPAAAVPPVPSNTAPRSSPDHDDQLTTTTRTVPTNVLVAAAPASHPARPPVTTPPAKRFRPTRPSQSYTELSQWFCELVCLIWFTPAPPTLPLSHEPADVFTALTKPLPSVDGNQPIAPQPWTRRRFQPRPMFLNAMRSLFRTLRSSTETLYTALYVIHRHSFFRFDTPLSSLPVLTAFCLFRPLFRAL